MDEQNQKVTYPKYRDYSFYIFVVVLVVAFFAAREIFQSASSEFGSYLWAFGIGGMVVGYLINVCLYECGKLIGGFIANYHLVYINVLGLMFYKNEEGKTKFKLALMENYGGATLMSPNHQDGSKTKPYLYHSLGAIVSLAINIIVMIVFIVVNVKTYNNVPLLFSLLSLLMSGIYVILNMTPVYSDDLLDGFTIRMLTHEEMRPIYFANLYNQEAYLTNRHDFMKLELDNNQNVFASENALYQYYYGIHHQDYVYAEKNLDIILQNQDFAYPYIYKEAYPHKYFFKLLNENTEKVKEEYLSEKKEYQRACVSSFDYSRLKTTLLIASLIEESYDYYEYLSNKIDKLHDKFDVSILKEDEYALIEKSLKKIEEIKPNWFIPYEEENHQEEPYDEEDKKQ